MGMHCCPREIVCRNEFPCLQCASENGIAAGGIIASFSRYAVCILATSMRCVHRLCKVNHTVELLQQLWEHDSTEGALRSSTAQRPFKSKSSYGLKRELIRTIGNMCYQCKEGQDEVQFPFLHTCVSARPSWTP